ncbi:hypothetical protein [Spiroplasma endosymbiont of Virgichneumon dumeticola]
MFPPQVHVGRSPLPNLVIRFNPIWLNIGNKVNAKWSGQLK